MAAMTPQEALAQALHQVDGYLAIEGIVCYCRRIATADGTHDGPIDDNWSSTRTYDPEDWGESAERPTYCERTAAAILDALPEGWELMATKHDWWPTARAEGAQQERERLRAEAKYIEWPAGAYALVVTDLLADPEPDR